jgi:hypothetical protein
MAAELGVGHGVGACAFDLVVWHVAAAGVPVFPVLIWCGGSEVRIIAAALSKFASQIAAQ